MAWTLLRAAFSPAGLLEASLARVRWPWLLTVPAAAFGLFFLQTGLDRAGTGTADWVKVLLFTLGGLVFGAVGVAAVALVAWAGQRLLRGNERPEGVIRAFALAYGPTLVYMGLGLAASVLLGWRTAVAFGVTGALWALGPMITALRQMTGKIAGSAALATICGALLLLGWSQIGRL